MCIVALRLLARVPGKVTDAKRYYMIEARLQKVQRIQEFFLMFANTFHTLKTFSYMHVIVYIFVNLRQIIVIIFPA